MRIEIQMSLSAFFQEFYSQKEDEEKSGAVVQAQPRKTNQGVGQAGFVRNNSLQTDLMKC